MRRQRGKVTLAFARNLWGQPVTADCRKRLSRVLRQTNRATWDDAYSLILNRSGTTLWQAVCALDSRYGGIGKRTNLHGRILKDWDKLPPQDLIREAVYVATH